MNGLDDLRLTNPMGLRIATSADWLTMWLALPTYRPSLRYLLLPTCLVPFPSLRDDRL